MNHGGTTGTTEDSDAGDQQRWIDELLSSNEAAALEAAPAAGCAAALASINRLRRRQRLRRSLSGLAAAAALAAVIAWPESPLPRREGSREGFTARPLAQAGLQEAVSENPSPSPSLRGRGMAEATFTGNGDAIAVHVASNTTNVTIVQLYPTTDYERRWRLEQELQQILSDLDGG